MSELPLGWPVEVRAGTAAELHGLGEPSDRRRLARVMTVTAPAIVLGSTQADDTVDPSRAAEAGISITRRHSGGGAVLLMPGEHVWIDLFVPAGDPLWCDDVVDGAQWVGELWRAATHELGGEHLHVHRAGLERSSWSSLVCFAGRGPGEVFTGDRKLVGVSQRRTRDWIRLQTLIHHVWDPARTLDVLELAPTARHQGERDLSSIVATADGDTDTVVAAVVAHLPT